MYRIINTIILMLVLMFTSHAQTLNLNSGETGTINCAGDHVVVGQPTGTQVTVECVAAVPPPTNVNVVVDHASIDLFDRIPLQYIEAARAKRVMVRTASVGQNISDGLNCIKDNTANACRTGFSVPASQVPIVLQPQYDRSSWLFEYRGNPGWYGKVQDFIDQFNQRYANFDIVSWKQSYVDDSTIYKFWLNTSLPDIFNVDATEAAHPQQVVVFWTAALAKTPIQYIEDFNQQMRVYASGKNAPLFDLADIENHRPDGSVCVANGLPVICSEYCVEANGGHLTNGMAQQRVAKGWWVIMARLAGWEP